MPAVSVWMLRKCHNKRCLIAHSRSSEKGFLRAIFWLSGITHIGVFLVAFTATLVPSLLPPRAVAPLHVMNSLLGVPECSQVSCSELGRRQAKLRQINEMTGTSSGFFFAVGLLCRVLGHNNMKISPQLLLRIFFVSLIAGPAAGSADVLLLRHTMARYIIRWKGSGRERHET
ncbi:hypothetical protein AAE478_003659 [Parahypoxylon ruwenzoriense]